MPARLADYVVDAGELAPFVVSLSNHAPKTRSENALRQAQGERIRVGLRPRATAVVVRDDRVLLVSDKAGMFMLPGGGLEHGERPEAAAARELHEETGLTATRTDYMFSWESGTNRHLIFLVEADGDVEIGSEISDFRWWDGREGLPRYPHVTVVLERLS